MKYDKELIIIRIIEGFVMFSIVYIFVFYLLKQMGIINTPFLLQITPQILAVISGLTVVFGLSEFFVKLKDLPASHEKLIKRVDRMAFGLTRVEKDVEFMRNDMNRFEAGVDKRFDNVEKKIDRLSTCKNFSPTA